MRNQKQCHRYCMCPPLAGTHRFEKFEVELKKHAAPLEFVPDNETLRFGPGTVKKSSRAAIFLVAVGQNVFLLRAILLNEEEALGRL